MSEKECEHKNRFTGTDTCSDCGKYLPEPSPSKRVEPIEKIEKDNNDKAYLMVGEDYLGFVTVTTLVDKLNELISHITALEERE